MTAATVTRTAGAEVIEEARATYARARDMAAGSREIGDAALHLIKALRRYDALRCGIVPQYFPGMRPGDFTQVLRMTADEAWAAAEEAEAAMEHYEGGK